MTDLVSDSSQQTSSPKRKFSFRFPHIHGVVGGGSGGSGGSAGSSHHHSSGSGSMGLGSGGGGGGVGGGGSAGGSRGGSCSDKDHLASSSSSGHHHLSGTLSSAYRERRNFSEEAKNVPDLHVSTILYFWFGFKTLVLINEQIYGAVMKLVLNIPSSLKKLDQNYASNMYDRFSVSGILLANHKVPSVLQIPLILGKLCVQMSIIK